MPIVTGNPIGLLLALTYTVEGGATYAPNWYVIERRYYMNFARKQSSMDYPIVFFMIDSTDHVSAKTGLTPTVTISKNGGAFGAAAGAVAEIANGWYSYAGHATDRNTLGTLAINAAAAGADDADLLCQIVSYDPFADIASILTDTGTDGVKIAADAITASVFDESTAFPLKSVDAGATAVARVGADSDTLETLSDQLDTVKTETAAIVADTNELQTDWVNGGRLDLLLDARASQASVDTIDGIADAILEDTSTTIPAQITALNNLSAANVNAEVVDVLRTDLIPDSYAADGAQPTIAQALLAILQFLTEKSVSGTTLTVYKPDGTTAAMTLTLSDATNPTSITRVS